MSFHYTVCISTSLRRDLHGLDIALLGWLFNADGDVPGIDPADALRGPVLEHTWLRDYLAKGADPAMASRCEISRGEDGDIIHASLMLFTPGHTLEGIFGEWLQLLRWLASLIAIDGHFATVVLEDGGDTEPFLFCSFEGRLFMKTEKAAVQVASLDSDETRTLSPRS